MYTSAIASPPIAAPFGNRSRSHDAESGFFDARELVLNRVLHQARLQINFCVRNAASPVGNADASRTTAASRPSDARHSLGSRAATWLIFPIRVLVVDDYKAFRRFAASVLGQLPVLQIVGEVSDGLEAVRKAGELQPNLILLDIGLPTLNGIDAARQIREHSPNSKILFF